MFLFMSMFCDTAHTKAELKAVKVLLFSSKTALIFMLQNTFKHTSELERLGVLVHVHVLGHSPSHCGAQGSERSSFSVPNLPWSFLLQAPLETYQNWKGLVLLLVSVCCDTAQTKAELEVVKALLFSSKPAWVIFATGHLQTQVRTGEACCCCLCQCVVTQPKPRQNSR